MCRSDHLKRDRLICTVCVSPPYEEEPNFSVYSGSCEANVDSTPSPPFKLLLSLVRSNGGVGRTCKRLSSREENACFQKNWSGLQSYERWPRKEPFWDVCRWSTWVLERTFKYPKVRPEYVENCLCVLRTLTDFVTRINKDNLALEMFFRLG